MRPGGKSYRTLRQRLVEVIRLLERCGRFSPRKARNVSKVVRRRNGMPVGTDYGALYGPLSRPLWIFAKRFQQAAVVDGTGMQTPTFGRFLGLRRDSC